MDIKYWNEREAKPVCLTIIHVHSRCLAIVAHKASEQQINKMTHKAFAPKKAPVK